MRTSTTDVRDLTAPTPRELAPLLDGRARFDEEEELGEPTLELDTPVAGARGTRPFASVELELGLAPFLERATLRRRHILLWALGGGLLLAVGLALFLTRAVVRPLDEMRELTRRVGAGDLEVRLGWRRRDVVGELSRALDAMADRLHAARDEQERTTRRLAALADRDPLTGVLNHRALHERLETELVRAERDRHPVSVLVLDVDAFKPVNDRLGHAAGDAVLRALSRALVSEGRAHDVAGRIGGESSCSCCPARPPRRPGPSPLAWPWPSPRRRPTASRSAPGRPSSPRTRARHPSCSSSPTPRCTARRHWAATAASCSRPPRRARARTGRRSSRPGASGS